jgi:cytochrome oxidase Cu insertion factor (SCO1/SenC/PrrC family)
MNSWTKQYDDPANAPENSERRKFLQTGVVTAGLVAAGEAKSWGFSSFLNASKKNAIEVLNQYNLKVFDGKDEQVKNIKSSGKSLKEILGGNDFTVYFGYHSCETVCDSARLYLGGISKKNPNIKHLVISVNPSTDKTKEDYKGFLEEMSYQGANRKNTILLYPSNREEAFQICQELGIPVTLVKRQDKKFPHAGIYAPDNHPLEINAYRKTGEWYNSMILGDSIQLENIANGVGGKSEKKGWLR